MAGSREITRVRPTKQPGPGSSTGSERCSQSPAFTSPTGRAARRIWRLVADITSPVVRTPRRVPTGRYVVVSDVRHTSRSVVGTPGVGPLRTVQVGPADHDAVPRACHAKRGTARLL